MTGWPDETRPGVPLHPEQTRLHWFRDESGAMRAVPWIVHYGSRGFWGGTFHHGLTYLGPCLTPDEVAAQLAAARREAVEEAARVCEERAEALHDDPDGAALEAEACAAAIRALAGKEAGDV